MQNSGRVKPNPPSWKADHPPASKPDLPTRLSIHRLRQRGAFCCPGIRVLQKEQEEDDPCCSNQEQLVRPPVDIEEFIRLWNHCNASGRRESSRSVLGEDVGHKVGIDPPDLA